MTLVATCPHCKTSFRVVADQLKLRRGLVRCGRCHQVFSGVDALTYLDDAAIPAPPAGLEPAPDRPTEQDSDRPPEQESDRRPEQESHRPPEQESDREPEHLPEPIAAPIPAPESRPAIEPPAEPALVDSMASPMARPEFDVDSALEPDPMARPRRAALLMVLIILGLLVASAQALIGWRHELAYRVPASQPWLTMLSAQFGLDLHPPRDARSLTIESFEVTAAEDPTQLSLEALIRNRSERPVAFPSIELTLRDSQSVMLVRRVIVAQAYVSPEQQGRGIPARSEWKVNILLEHDGLAVAGYSAVLFHP